MIWLFLWENFWFFGDMVGCTSIRVSQGVINGGRSTKNWWSWILVKGMSILWDVCIEGVCNRKIITVLACICSMTQFMKNLTGLLYRIPGRRLRWGRMVVGARTRKPRRRHKWPRGICKVASTRNVGMELLFVVIIELPRSRDSIYLKNSVVREFVFIKLFFLS